MIPFQNREVEAVFRAYPDHVRSQMLALRDLVFTTAESEGLGNCLAESLKWGEPSYSCPGGSAVRMDWKQSDPECYRMFFHCQTFLVGVFRELFPDVFHYEGKRAIRFGLKDDPDLATLARCVGLALRYHSVKHLPQLGAFRDDST